jgi:phosphoglycerate kinase
MAKKTVEALAVKGKRVLIRADLNVPLDGQHQVTDDRRIRMFLPTLQHVLKNGGRAIVMSHLGRPKGDPDADKRDFSLKPVADRMQELLGQPVRFAEDCIGAPAREVVDQLGDGDVALLENLRFHKGENIIDKAKKNPDKQLTPEQEQTRQQFAEQLSSLGEVYVNDAFGTCHRQHVSMYDVPQRMPAGNRAVGFLVKKELDYLGQAVQEPERPFVAVLGGAKVSDKIGVIRNLLGKVDKILIGGAMMFTFWKAQGREIGKSLCEDDKLDLARSLLEEGGDKLILPVDTVAGSELKAGVATQVSEGEVPGDMMGLDIGPQTIDRFKQELRGARTIVWNGPLGAFETKPFDRGTIAIAEVIAAASDQGATSVIGGGDSASAVEQAGLADRMSHISTGGGASLEFLEGKPFQTIEVLDNA